MRVPELNKEFIEKCLAKCMLQSEIAKHIGCSRQLVIRRAKQYGISFERRLKYPVDNKYFNEWTHSSSYILGFLMADGCIRKKKNKNSYELKIEVNEKDMEVLEFIRQEISPSRPIRTNIIHKNKSGSISYSACLSITVSEACYDRLIYLGVKPRKSGHEIIPSDLPKEFMWSYICGLFDGDGSVYERTSKNAGGFDWYICSSSKKLISQLFDYISIGKIKSNKNMFSIAVRNKPEIRIIRQKIYANVPFYLKRKRQIMDSV